MVISVIPVISVNRRTEMAAPILIRSAYALGKPPDKIVEREVIYSQAITFSTSCYMR